MSFLNKKMCQYSVWANCCNNCDFCLRKERHSYTKDMQMIMLDNISKNIECIDWKNEYPYGISLLGGELYYITDSELQEKFLKLIDKIIEYILIPLKDNNVCKYSTVTNGLYNPNFLFRVIDKIKNAVGISMIDVNFSYDEKYRYKSEEDRLLVLKNIKEFSTRYNYKLGVQMILAQYIIDRFNADKTYIDSLIEKISNNNLQFLYPHPVNTGKILNDFFFNRKDFLQFITILKNKYPNIYLHFLHSTKNSAIFKYTGLKPRSNIYDIDITVQPVLSDGKEEINKTCGHSVLYQCYSDCKKCMLCDLISIDSDLIY